MYLCSVFHISTNKKYEFMTARERLLKIIELEGKSSKQFAEMVGVSAGTISNIANGRNNASLDVLQRVRARFPKYAVKWVYEGLGDMYSDTYDGQDGQVCQDSQGSRSGQDSLGSHDRQDVELDLFIPEATKEELQPEAATLPIDGDGQSRAMNRPDVSLGVNRTITKIVVFYSDGTFEER